MMRWLVVAACLLFATPALAQYTGLSGTGNTLTISTSYAAETATGVVSGTLPALSGVTAGQAITVTDAANNAASNNITISAAGSDTIVYQGVSSGAAVLNQNGVTVAFVKSNGAWQQVSSIGFYANTYDLVRDFGAVSGRTLSDATITATVAAKFTATISGTTMNVTGVASGTLAVSQVVTGPNVAAGTTISPGGSGSGGTGTYNLNQASTVGGTGEPMTSYSSSLNVLTSATGDFTSNDVGKVISIGGAGAGIPYGSLVTTISAVNSLTNITLGAPASTTVVDSTATYWPSVDNQPAIQAWANMAISGNVQLTAPPVNYLFKEAVNWPTANGGIQSVSINGAGAYSTTFTYAGVNTNNDIWTFGDGNYSYTGWRVHGITLTTNTTMTGGACMVVHGFARALFTDVIWDGIDGSGRCHDGVAFKGFNIVIVDGFQARAKNDNIEIFGSGTTGSSDIFINNGRTGWPPLGAGIAPTNGTTSVGVHVAGDVGGLTLGVQFDDVSNGIGMLIDDSGTSVGNRQIFVYGVLDKTYSGPNIQVNDSMSSGLVLGIFNWVASSGGTTTITGPVTFNSPCIYIESMPAGLFTDNGNVIYNCAGDAIRVDQASAYIYTSPATIIKNFGFGGGGGYGVNCTTMANTINIGSTPISVISSSSGLYSADCDPILNYPVGGLVQYSSIGQNAGVGLYRADGTALMPSRVTGGDILGGVVAQGYDGTIYRPAAAIYGAAQGSVSTGTVPGEILFETATTANPSVLTSAGYIDNTQIWHLLAGVTVGGSGVALNGVPYVSGLPPTVTSGLGTSPIVSASGTGAFLVTVGSTGTPSTAAVLGMPSANKGWACTAQDVTAGKMATETAYTTTSVTETFASAPANSEKIVVQCGAF